MKLYVRMLEKLIELPECLPESAAKSALRHLLDDLGLEVKGVELNAQAGVVFTIETLANRGDHLYALGVAREISGRTLAQIKVPALAAQLPDKKASMPVRRVTDKCLRYGLLEMTLPVPMPLRNDVAACLEEPGKHHAMVDLLNYVQQEFGQPMHAFDADKVEGEVVIDCATKVEEVEALDGKTYKVPEGSILIRDRKKIIAVAGVIGCANSMVTEGTRKVVVEAATFDPVSVRVTARAMGLATDASHFFERGCDPEGIVPALKRLVYLAGGSAGAVNVSDVAHALGFSFAEAASPEKRKLSISLSSIRSHVNLPRLEETEILARLKNLGFSVEVAAAGKDKILSMIVPSWRLWDIRNPEDIVEEVARSISFSRVKIELPALEYNLPERDPIEILTERIRPALRGSGFTEVITKGFYSAGDVALLESLEKGAADRHVGIKNALELSNSHMKVTNVVHLVKLLSANRKRGIISAKVFESCRLFSKPSEVPSDDPKPRTPLVYNFERDVLTLAFAGRWSESEWRKEEPLDECARLFKGAVSEIVRSLGGELSVGKSDSGFLHPGVQASLKVGRSVVGFFGVVHPAIREAYDLKDEAFYCELDVAALCKVMRRGEPLEVSDLPPICRDMTLKIGVKEQAGRVVRLIEETGIESLNQVAIVDDFRKAEEDYRRVTYRVTFQRSDRTLKHEEVDQGMASLLQSLKERHGVEMAGA
jgi:phenylalanyl-tRNA synthetase beta chain